MTPELHPSHDEWFRFLGLVFDVSKARALLASRKRPPKVDYIETSQLEPLLSMRIRNAENKVTSLRLGIGVDWNRIEKDMTYDEAVIDLKVPLILAYTAEGVVPIDGYHRIGKAVLQKVEKLPYYLLTKSESAKARVR
jgi:hypothetical protein